MALALIGTLVLSNYTKVLLDTVLMQVFDMKFDYHMYLKCDLYVPLGALLFCIALIVINIVGFFQNDSSKTRFQYIFFICFTLCFASIFVIQFIRGIPLLKDHELETVEVSGIVEKIEDITFSTRHTIGRDIRSSVYITVNGERYYSVSLPGIDVGDRVKLGVFTNSHFIASCELVIDNENVQMGGTD